EPLPQAGCGKLRQFFVKGIAITARLAAEADRCLLRNGGMTLTGLGPTAEYGGVRGVDHAEKQVLDGLARLAAFPAQPSHAEVATGRAYGAVEGSVVRPPEPRGERNPAVGIGKDHLGQIIQTADRKGCPPGQALRP